MVSDGKTILYSGHKRWHMHMHIITTRFLSQHAKTTIVQVYAPTEDAVETKKDAFYNQLQDVINEVPRHDVTVLRGDFNAQISANQQGLEHVIGPYGTGCHITNNGECLLLFCNTNGLCIGNTFFTHKQIHKKTWCGPNGLTNNKIDYVCVSRRWRSALQDTCVYRGADVGSDHHLLKAVLKLQLKKQRAIRGGKAAGQDQISSELLKHGGPSMIQALTQLMNECREEEQIPDEWRQGMIVKLKKKGNITVVTGVALHYCQCQERPFALSC
ncbi:Craniofacial development protein 2 [Labeo rohita]|uniref:Craniofacial development protein 2 n=1 Tax=Labeo rohita TaxID=84645 RepID=A0ABQ8MKI7_LABRO|nr:Craniofacial development protein 2 [Labeo rohita]